MSLPIDCNLGEDCFIQQYVDHDPSEAASDFRCSNLTYDTHQGTDFALVSTQQMRRGVDVRVAAPGTVRATRDGMRDQVLTAETADQLDGRDCGNGVFVDHDHDWSTQYCHLRQGSITVSQGDHLAAGTVLGQVGLSGRTQFPHLHITVRRGDHVIDPFAPEGVTSCDAPTSAPLWDSPVTYQPGAVILAGFADAVPTFDAIKAGTAVHAILPATAPALVVFGYAFGGQAGDTVRMRIDGPEGAFIDSTDVLERDQAQFFRASGRRLRAQAWPAGTYTGTVSLIRANEVINTQTASVRVE